MRMTLFNIYRSMLHSVNDTSDFDYVITAITRLLSNVHQAENTLLPYSTKQVCCRWC